MFKLFNSTVKIVHEFLGQVLREGGTAIDATVGNGNDTVVLARLVGKSGKVYGFDIQEEAIKNTGELVKQAGYGDVVKLFLSGHEEMINLVPEFVDAIVFNLGYLPGGNHTITTCPATTVNAVKDGLKLLKPGGIVCIVVYPGHEAGAQEEQILEAFWTCLDKTNYCVGKLNFPNRNKAPYPVIIERSM